MTSGQFRHLRELFEAALDKSAAEQAEWLREACQGDAQLLEGVERLLAADALAESGRTFSVAYIKNRTARAAGMARLVQDLDVSSYVGKRIRVSALLRSNAIEEFGGLLFGIAYQGGLVLGNRRNLVMHGTNEWSRQSVVFDVEGAPAGLKIGFALSGAGAIWADSFSIEVVDTRTPVTRVFPSAPVDTDFDGRKQ